MANPRFNKQVANPRGMKVGGRVKKMGGGMSTRRNKKQRWRWQMHNTCMQSVWPMVKKLIRENF